LRNIELASSGSTVVEHCPQNLKVEGTGPATATGTIERERKVLKIAQLLLVSTGRTVVKHFQQHLDLEEHRIG
jgi:hypothetical protein